MPSRSFVPRNCAANGARNEMNIKREDREDENGNLYQPALQENWGEEGQPGGMPPPDLRAVTPGPIPETSKSALYNDGEEIAAQHYTSGILRADGAGDLEADPVGDDGITCQPTSKGGGENVGPGSDYEGHIVLSLALDMKYKEKINAARDKLWREDKGASLNGLIDDLARGIFDECKVELEESGGSFWRLTPNANKEYKASDEAAQEKIIADLKRGKYDYKYSIFYKGRKPSSLGKTPPNDGDGGNKDDARPPRKVAPSGPSKRPSPPDLVVSLRDPGYKKIIDEHVQAILGEGHSRSTEEFASEQVKAVERQSGRFFSIGAKERHQVEIRGKKAAEKIIKDVEGKLSDERRNDDRIVIVNMNNIKYKDVILEGAKTLAEKSDNIGAGAMGKILFEQYKSAGAHHFFKNAKDDHKMTSKDALAKITKDVQVQARNLRKVSEPQVENDDGQDDVFVSSTRKRKGRGGSTIQCTPSVYIWDYITRNLLTDLAGYGLEVKQIIKNGLDEWVAHRTEPGAKNDGVWCNDFIGLENILNEAYLLGFYDDKVLGTEEGREWLERAGIHGEPYSIFDEDIIRQRKRRKESGSLRGPHGASRDAAAVENTPDEEDEQDLVPGPSELRMEPVESPRKQRNVSMHPECASKNSIESEREIGKPVWKASTKADTARSTENMPDEEDEEIGEMHSQQDLVPGPSESRMESSKSPHEQPKIPMRPNRGREKSIESECAIGTPAWKASLRTDATRLTGSPPKSPALNIAPIEGDDSSQLKSQNEQDVQAGEGDTSPQPKTFASKPTDGDASSQSRNESDPQLSTFASKAIYGDATGQSKSPHESVQAGDIAPTNGEANSEGQARKEMPQSTSTLQLSRRLGGAIQVTQQVKQLYNHIRSRLSCAKDGKNGAQQTKENILALQVKFYRPLKRWLAQKAEAVLQPDLVVIQTLVQQFESTITELEETSNDEDDILCYTNICESVIKKCKEALPE